MIKLKFKVESFYWTKDYIQKCKKYNIERDYDENVKFGNVLLGLYEELGIGNEKQKRINYFINDLNKTMWQRFFKKEIYNNIDYELDDYEKLTVKELETQFKISALVFKLVINLDGIGGCVGERDGIRFVINTREKDRHNNAHVHCTYSGINTRIEIKILKVLDKPFKKSKMDIALSIIKKNQEGLLNYWNTCTINGESMKFKMII